MFFVFFSCVIREERVDRLREWQGLIISQLHFYRIMVTEQQTFVKLRIFRRNNSSFQKIDALNTIANAILFTN